MPTPRRRKPPPQPHASIYAARLDALKARVAEAAKALQEQGIRPTVTRIRAALDGGSPNDIAPALKHWRDAVLPTLPPRVRDAVDLATKIAAPPQIADLAHELWQRATAAALVELRGGATARQVAARTEEAQSLRNQLTTLRDQLQRDSLAYGELRTRAARYEAMAREALARGQASDKRERNLLRELGAARLRIAELEATAKYRTNPRDERADSPSARRVARRPKAKPVAALSRVAKRRKRTSRRPNNSATSESRPLNQRKRRIRSRGARS